MNLSIEIIILGCLFVFLWYQYKNIRIKIEKTNKNFIDTLASVKKIVQEYLQEVGELKEKIMTLEAKVEFLERKNSD